MDIKEFKELHEYINSCINDNDEELISELNDIKYDLFLIKEKLHIKDEAIELDDDRISGK